jgi:hypothetical protein
VPRSSPDRAEDEATPLDPATPRAVGDLGTAEDMERGSGRRTLGFVVCIGLWIIIVVTLGGDAVDEGGGGSKVVAAYGAAVFFTLGFPALIRLVYVLLRKRRFWSPWLFFIAALIATVSLVGQNRFGRGGNPIAEYRTDVAEKTLLRLLYLQQNVIPSPRGSPPG